MRNVTSTKGVQRLFILTLVFEAENSKDSSRCIYLRGKECYLLRLMTSITIKQLAAPFYQRSNLQVQDCDDHRCERAAPLGFGGNPRTPCNARDWQHVWWARRCGQQRPAREVQSSPERSSRQGRRAVRRRRQCGRSIPHTPKAALVCERKQEGDVMWVCFNPDA